MKETLDQMLDHYQRHGDGDDVGLWQIISGAIYDLGIDQKKTNPAEAKELWNIVSYIVTGMLQNGFIVVTLNGGSTYSYTAWPEQDPKQVMAKIRNMVIEAKGKLDDVMYGVWFHKINQQPRRRNSLPPPS